jgi:hypothetical protein
MSLCQSGGYITDRGDSSSSMGVHFMQAHLVGFLWELGKGISLNEFFAHLKSQHNVATKFGSYDRLLYISERDDYFLGLFLTVKDQRKVPEIQQAGEDYIVKVRDLDDDSSLIDFNFFAVNKTSAKGLYQHYHNSCSLNQFGLFCRRHYDDLRDAKIRWWVIKCAARLVGRRC